MVSLRARDGVSVGRSVVKQESAVDNVSAVLLVGGDDTLVAACRAVAAAAGVPLEVRANVVDAADLWEAAALVLLAAEPVFAAESEAVEPRRRRPGIVLVTEPPVGEHVWRAAVSVGAEHVVVLPEARSWLAQRMLEATQAGLGSGRVVAVAGGCGGAGASVLAAGLAWTAAARGLRAVVVDADPLGGGIDLVLGAEAEPGLRWPDLAAARGRLQPGALSALLPWVDGVGILSWDRGDLSGRGCDVPAEAARAVLAGARAEADVVAVDLPRRMPPGSAAWEGAATCDLALLVVPAHVRAAAAAVCVLAGLREVAADVRVVVRGTSGGPAPVTIADALAVPLAGVLRREPSLDSALDRGEPPTLRRRGGMRQACEDLLAILLEPATGRWGGE